MSNRTGRSPTCEFVGKSSALLSVFLSALSAWTWLAGVAELCVIGSHEPMAPCTAAAALAVAIGVWIAFKWPGQARSCHGIRLAGTASALICTGALLSFALGWQSPLESGLWALLATTQDVLPHCMAPVDATTFLAAASSLLLLARAEEQFRWRRRIGTILAAAIALFALARLAGILMGGRGTSLDYTAMPVALLAIVNLLLLGVALICLGQRGWVRSAAGEGRLPSECRSWTPFILTSISAVVIGIASAAYLRHEQDEGGEKAQELLAAVALLKESQIVNWREERMNDARFFARAEFVARDIASFLAKPQSERARTNVQHWLNLLKSGDRYALVAFFDTNANVRLALPPNSEHLRRVAPESIRSALHLSEVNLSDFQRSGDNAPLHIDVSFRVSQTKGSQVETLGVILLRLDPRHFLFPMIQTWPTPSRTAEVVLFRREGNDVVYLNDFTPRSKLGLSRRFAVATNSALPSVKALLGKTGIIEGVDFRGKSVLADARQVSGTTWYVLAKIERDEVFGALKTSGWLTMLLTVVLVTSTGLATSFVVQRQEAAVSERELIAERRRRELAERMEHLLKHANEAIFLADSQLSILEANERAICSYGYTLDEFRTMGLIDLHSPAARASFDTAKQNLRLTGRAVLETEHQRKDGTVFPVEVSSNLVEIGGTHYTLGLARDITARKRAAEAAQAERDFSAEVISRTPTLICGVTPDGTTTFVNPAGEKVTGYSSAEIVGKNWWSILYPGEEYSQVKQLLRALAAGDVKDFEMILTTRAGDKRVISWTSFSRRDLAGKVTEFLGFGNDITERVQLELQLRQAQKMEAIGQLAGGVAHDFNNILASTMLHLGLLQQRDDLDAELQESLNELSSHAQRAAALTRQLLLFSRRSVMQTRVLDLNESVENLLKMLRRIIGEQIHLEWHSEPQLPPVSADAGMIDQVIMNLVVNARDAMAHGGRIRIMAECVSIDPAKTRACPDARAGRFVCLSVSDTGCGIEARILKRIFEPFFTTKPAGKGTGLGLATVYGIAKQHEGWVSAESTVGKGSTFRVFLPIASISQDGLVRTSTIPAIHSGSERVLLVEDDPSVRSSISRLLHHCGYKVYEAGDASEARRLWDVQQSLIDILVTDMVMPGGVSGLQLAEELKTEKRSLKAMICSGYSPDLVNPKSLGEKGIFFLQKPCSTEAFTAALRQAIESPSGPSGS